MKEGDRNIKFFHSFVKMHHDRNKILKLQNDDGTMIEDYNQVQDIATKFFENLFTDPFP